MEIRQITPQKNIRFANPKYKNSPKIMQSKADSADFLNYPKSYYINFGARKINNQDIINGAPYEVEKCLCTIKNDPRYGELISKNDGLYTIHQKVYKGLENCKTVEDVKAAFPGFTDDSGKQCGTFVNLLPIGKVKDPKTPLVRNLKEIDDQGIQILKDGTEVSVYLLKKLLFEGKSYKDTMSALSEDLTDKAKEKINVEIKGYAEVMKDFGVIMPDGANYLHTLRASANPTETMKLLDSMMQPQELTEQIPRALESKDPRVRVSMIYAWNQCVDIREDLSQFLHYNLDNPEFSVEDPEYDVYNPDFHRKMSKIMKAFWSRYPEHCEKLSEEITKAYKVYDSIKPEDLKEFINKTENESSKIRTSIKEKFKNEREHKVGKDLLFHISKIICTKNPYIAGFVNDEFKFDFYKLLLKNTTNKELQTLEGDKDSEEFQTFVRHGIREKARKIKNSSDYEMLMETQKFAYLKAVESKLGSAKDIDALYGLNDEDSIKLFVSVVRGKKDSGLSNLPVNLTDIKMLDIFNNYSVSKQPVGSRAKYIEKTVTDSVPKGSADEEKVKSLITKYPQFLLELKNEELPREKQRALLDGFWRIYDIENGTSCHSDFERNFDTIKSQKEKEEVQFDFECDDLIGDIF